jgi:methylisocitrate lyase
MIEHAGFEGLYISGASIANGVAGYPDIGLMTQTEMATQAGYIARTVNIPAIADADDGYGEPLHVFRTVQAYERAGISGLHLEDQQMPKRCGHLDGKRLISSEHMIEKIQAACAARQNQDLLIIARTDAFALEGLSGMLNRAQAYYEAGADMIFVEALPDEATFQRTAQLLSGIPLLANMTEFGKSPLLSHQQLADFGYKAVIYPMTMFRVMMNAVNAALSQLKQQGTQADLLPAMMTRQQLYDLLHYDAYQDLDHQLSIRPDPEIK